MTKETFISKVKKTKTCWLWTGAVRSRDNAYGTIGNGKNRILAHRFSYILHIGKIPNGKCVLHKCDTPLCVNPKHLFIGTVAENNADRAKKGRTVAPRGEEQHSAKLTEDLVKYIRREYPKKSLRKLAKEMNVDFTNISCIVRRKTWKHVK